IKRDSRMQQTIAAQYGACADDAARTKPGAGADACASLDHTMRADADAISQLRIRRYNGCGMYAFFETLHTMAVEPLCQQGIHDIGLTAQNDAIARIRSNISLKVRFGQDDRRRPA